MTEILVADNLATLESVRHGFFTRAFGNAGFSGQPNSSEVYTHRARMAKYLEVEPDHLLTAFQDHTPDAFIVEKPFTADKRPRADALATNMRGIALGVLTADCVPVLFACSDTTKRAHVIGVAHAGWRGAISGVLENTLLAMERLGAQRKHIEAAIGPCIWQNSYEVGPEFPGPFLAESPRNEIFFKAAFKSNYYMFNLPAYVSSRLKEMGVGYVCPSPADTCADPERFFSHRYSTLRNEQRRGNLMSAIALI